MQPVRILLFLFGIGLLLLVQSPIAQAQESREFDIKAAFISKFSKFIKWPEGMNEGSTLNIGYIGQGPLIDSLKLLEGKNIDGQTLHITKPGKTLRKKKIQILVFSPNQGADYNSLLTRFKKRGVLTIGDAEGFCEQGGMINFYMKTGKVRFEINMNAVQEAGIKISSKLLRLARIVNSK